MSPKEIAHAAIQRLNARITNEVFLIIQNDRELMKAYLRCLEDTTLDTLNQTIGREIKVAYGLTNMDEREDDPSCTLIQSHQKFE